MNKIHSACLSGLASLISVSYGFCRPLSSACNTQPSQLHRYFRWAAFPMPLLWLSYPVYMPFTFQIMSTGEWKFHEVVLSVPSPVPLTGFDSGFPDKYLWNN